MPSSFIRFYMIYRKCKSTNHYHKKKRKFQTDKEKGKHKDPIKLINI